MIHNYCSFLYFFLYNYVYIYIERGNIICVSKLGSFKCKFNLYFFLYNSNSLFIFKFFLINSLIIFNDLKQYTKNKINFQLFISLFLVSIFSGFRAKFKIHGRGYKLHKKNNNLVFKLGYSHLIFKTLDFALFLKKKEKKKVFYTLISLNHQLLTNTISTFRSFRIPNIYTKKGILNNTKKIIFKIGKINMV
ncbi:50S ribosomal protein L6 [compost metagenome]